MARKLSPDKLLFATTLVLALLGVVMVFSASAVPAEEKFGSPYYFLIRQGAWTLLGLIGMWWAMHVDYRTYRHPLCVYGGLFVCILLLVGVFLMDPNHNTHRWIRLGSLSFQPSELSKPALVIFMAALLEKEAARVNDWRHTLLPCLAVLFVVLGLIVAEPDLGTSITMAAVAFLLLFCAGLRLTYMLGAGLLALPPLFYLVFFFEYRMQRVLAFLDPWSDPLGSGFQPVQSMIAVGSGGLTGLGLMAGKQKLFYVPEPHTDFIYAVIGEEWGLAGALAVLGLFGVFLWRGVRLSLRAQDGFGRFLGLGLTAMIVCQAFVNISVVLSLLPTKGIPLPFVSSGGSSLLVSLISVGVLLNISQHSD